MEQPLAGIYWVEISRANTEVQRMISEDFSKKPVSISTERFFIRELCVADVTSRYMSWLSDSIVQEWINTASDVQRIEDLKNYVSKRIGRTDVLFLGIFDKISGLHIGNIKYEPILSDQRTAVMGVLIGDPDFRGKKVFSEVFIATAVWLKNVYQINRIYLGVEKTNIVAIKAYQNTGFVETHDFKNVNIPSVLMMVFNV